MFKRGDKESGYLLIELLVYAAILSIIILIGMAQTKVKDIAAIRLGHVQMLYLGEWARSLAMSRSETISMRLSQNQVQILNDFGDEWGTWDCLCDCSANRTLSWSESGVASSAGSITLSSGHLSTSISLGVGLGKLW